MSLLRPTVKLREDQGTSVGWMIFLRHELEAYTNIRQGNAWLQQKAGS